MSTDRYALLAAMAAMVPGHPAPYRRLHANFADLRTDAFLVLTASTNPLIAVASTAGSRISFASGSAGALLWQPQLPPSYINQGVGGSLTDYLKLKARIFNASGGSAARTITPAVSFHNPDVADGAVITGLTAKTIETTTVTPQADGSELEWDLSGNRMKPLTRLTIVLTPNTSGSVPNTFITELSLEFFDSVVMALALQGITS